MKNKTIRGSIVILFISLITAFIFNHYSPNGIPLFGQWNPEKGIVKAVPDKEANNIGPKLPVMINDLDSMDQIIKNDQKKIVDVRSTELYKKGHIPGALNFPMIQFEDNFQQMISVLKPNDSILLYCSGAECTDSHAFAEILINMQYSDISIFTKGFQGWESEGRKVIIHEE